MSCSDSQDWWDEARFTHPLEHSAMLVKNRIPQLLNTIKAYGEGLSEEASTYNRPGRLVSITDQIRSAIRRISTSLSLIIREMDKEQGFWSQWQQFPGLMTVQAELSKIDLSSMDDQDVGFQEWFEQATNQFFERIATSKAQREESIKGARKRKRASEETESEQLAPMSKKWRRVEPGSGHIPQMPQIPQIPGQSKVKKIIMTNTQKIEWEVAEDE